jgi:hypothetical protein
MEIYKVPGSFKLHINNLGFDHNELHEALFASGLRIDFTHVIRMMQFGDIDES